MPAPPPQTPDRPEESGQPLQQRPGQKAGDFIERDLWNIDADWDETDEESEAAETQEASPVQERELDAPAAKDTDQAEEGEVTKLEEVEEVADAVPADDPAAGIKEDEAEPPPAGQTAASPASPGDAGDAETAGKLAEPAQPTKQPQLDLEEREDSGDAPDIGQKDDSDWDLDPADDAHSTDSPAPEAPATEAPATATGDPKADLDDEFHDPEPQRVPEQKPKSLRLSFTEVISLGLVLALILGGLGWFLWNFFNDIPTRQSSVLVPDFPVRGELVSIESAASFWREPIRTGPDADTARRGAELIPVIDLKIKETKGDGNLRVFFRDESGEPVGDPATRAFSNGLFTINGTDQLQLAATAGFDDEGKHAAYQTAETEPWTVEVFEGPQDAASFKDFRLLFKLTISAERR